MKEFLGVYGKAAQLHQSSGILIKQPVYMVVFLLHVLAHSTDVSLMECQEEEARVAIFRYVGNWLVPLMLI